MEVITANSLADGRVVFRSVGGWTHVIDQAQVLEGKEVVAAAVARANADAAANIVVDPYPIPVTRSASGLVPARLRERIRAEGPTTGNSKTAPANPGKAA